MVPYRCRTPSVDLVSIEIAPVVAPCIEFFEIYTLWDCVTTTDPFKLAEPKPATGERDRFVFIKWLFVMTTLLAVERNKAVP
jgi:hypothetical protein